MFKAYILSSLLLFNTVAALAQESPLSVSGRLQARAVGELHDDSKEAGPGFEGRLKLDYDTSNWRFRSWLEGGWDGNVQRPARDNSLFKSYDEVYQSNTPYLEFKEFFGTYSSGDIDIRAGIQRFAWGRIDEYPSNDLLNPWDYSKFPREPLEERKLGVPSFSLALNRTDWALESVWIPIFVPYRLAMPDERWSGVPVSSFLNRVPNAEIVVQRPDLPDRSLDNGNFGLRAKYLGDIEWTLNLFHGYDPRPVFRTTALSITESGGKVFIDPGFVPDFHRITTAGIDAAFLMGDLSIRAEVAYAFNRYLNISRELWGYPLNPRPGVYPLNPAQQKRDTVDYGIGADYRLFEDGHLTVQGQQTIIVGNADRFYERKVETILWANLKAAFMNQKIETNSSLAYNPEHGDHMTKLNAGYVFSDSWKAGATYITFTGPAQSFLGRYSRNDQVEAEVVYSW